MNDPIRLRLRDTELHDDMGGAGQRIWTTAGQGYIKTWFVEELPVVDLLARCRWEINNLREKLTRGEQEGWEGSKRRTVLMADVTRFIGQSASLDPDATKLPDPINEVR